MAECHTLGKHRPAAVPAAGVAGADTSDSEVEEVPDPQTPKQKGKTDIQQPKEQERAFLPFIKFFGGE